jgi:hypothetical protein
MAFKSADESVFSETLCEQYERFLRDVTRLCTHCVVLPSSSARAGTQRNVTHTELCYVISFVTEYPFCRF